MVGSDSNEPTIPYGFGSQHPIVPPSLNDFNMPPNPFNVLTTMAVVDCMRNTAPNHRSHPSRLQFRRPQCM